MRICYLSAASSYHTHKWSKFFSERGHEVHIISLTEGTCPYGKVHYVNVGMKDRYDSPLKKLAYITNGRKVKRLLEQIKPDIIHAHRVPSYGGLCALNNVSPFYLSVWGGDIYGFPNRSFLHKWLVKATLKAAICIMSTSYAMKTEIEKYTDKDILVTPFGVDMKLFTPERRKREDNANFVIGNIKSLERRYGIDDLLEAASIVLKKRKDIPISVRIAGKGSYEDALRKRATELGIADRVRWLGFIDQVQVADEWANMDVAVISSVTDSESFGVSAVEAQASGIPVIVTDIAGLMEATKPGVSSIVVERNSPQQLAEQIIYLYDNPNIRKQMGLSARSFVKERYELAHCFEIVEKEYERAIQSRSGGKR